jgi:hypothetical protein
MVVRKLGTSARSLMAPVEQTQFPKIDGRSAAMCDALKGELIARDRVCSHIEGWAVLKPYEGCLS